MKESGQTLVKSLKSLSLAEGVVRRSQAQFLRLGQAGRLGQSDIRSYYVLSGQYRSVFDNIVGWLVKNGINGGIDKTSDLDVPTIPDVMVRRALPEGISRNVQALVAKHTAQWEGVFEKNAKRIFDKDAISVNGLAKKLLTEHPDILMKMVPEDIEDESVKVLGYAAAVDLYVQSRLQDEGKPKEVFPSIPSWALVAGGLILGGGVGYVIGKITCNEDERDGQQ